MIKTKWVSLTGALVLASSSALLGSNLQAKGELPKISHDGLELVEESKMGVVYLKPGADFSGYKRVAMLDCHVAFKKNWQREQNDISRGGGPKVRDRDVERIKERLADEFRNVFIDVLDVQGGYEVVAAPADDVLLVGPAIIDLDITAPDLASTNQRITFAANAGQATLYLELYDSVSGEILLRVIDRRAGSKNTNIQWANQIDNAAEARTMLTFWAEALRDGMDKATAKKRG